MNELLIHPRTRAQIELFLNKPAHALLITGLSGSGKYSLARLISVKLLNLNGVSELDKYPYFWHLAKAEKQKEISIESIRSLVKQLSLKTPGRSELKRIVVIENAELLSLAAQNALLKILEEPPLDTVFILTSISDRSVLPTIASRNQKLSVFPVSLELTQAFFADSYSPEIIAKNWNLAQGAAGLLSALLSNSNEHYLKIAVEEAKLLLSEEPAQRLVRLQKTKYDRQNLEMLLDALSRILSSLHKGALAKTNQAQASKISRNRKLVTQAQKYLAANVQPRLICTNLALNLSV